MINIINFNLKTKGEDMGKFKTEIRSVSLKSCCKRKIKEINQVLYSSKALQIAMISGVFATIFISPTDSIGRGGSVTTTFSLWATDWTYLSNALISVPKITKRRIKDICFLEMLDHETYNDQKLRTFWESLYENF